MAGYVPAALSKKERYLAMEEVWKDVVGYEGLYQVSNKGNVKSLNWKNTGKQQNLFLKPHNKGYLQVELAKDGKKKCFVVHRLVATAFIPNPLGLPQVNHKDENKRNNFAENLEWCNASYNVNYSLELHRDQSGKGVPTRKRANTKRANQPINQFSQDGSLVKTWSDSRTIYLETGMSDWSITQCCRGNRHTAYGYTWQYAN